MSEHEAALITAATAVGLFVTWMFTPGTGLGTLIVFGITTVIIYRIVSMFVEKD